MSKSTHRAVEAVALAELTGGTLADARVNSGLSAGEFDGAMQAADFGQVCMKRHAEMVDSGEASGVLANRLIYQVLKKTHADVATGKADGLDVEPILKIAVRALGEMNRVSLAKREVEDLPTINYVVVLNDRVVDPVTLVDRGPWEDAKLPAPAPLVEVERPSLDAGFDFSMVEPLPLDDDMGGAA